MILNFEILFEGPRDTFFNHQNGPKDHVVVLKSKYKVKMEFIMF